MRSLIFAILVVVLYAAPCVRACSACQGNPNSEMVKGAQGGVIVMVLVTYSVLLTFGGMVALWMVRTRRIRRANEAAAQSPVAKLPEDDITP